MRVLNIPKVGVRVPSINCTLHRKGNNVNMIIRNSGFRFRSLKRSTISIMTDNQIHLCYSFRPFSSITSFAWNTCVRLINPGT
jgi:hypothetical protein